VKDVRPILGAASADGLVSYPVSTRVNSVRDDDPTLIAPVPEPATELPTGTSLSLFR
jgi:putative SOS response-associated peptidase YedK